MSGAPRDEIVHVGDSLENDYRGATEAGLRAVFLARNSKFPEGVRGISTLAELEAHLLAADAEAC